RPRDRRRAARWCRGRAGLHLAEQAGPAHHPLPHPRSDPAAAAHLAQHAAHGQDRRPQRRHADHPRRQYVPDPDRGARAAGAAALGPVPDRGLARGRTRRSGGALRAAAGRRSRRWQPGRPGGQVLAAPHQDPGG
ncbi:Uncharacterized protein APZ42_002601, partial [Daphnia magna]